jgi:hypothetical protein
MDRTELGGDRRNLCFRVHAGDGGSRQNQSAPTNSAARAIVA